MTFSPSQITAAYDHCERIVSGHYENFPVASLLLPRGKRRQVAAIYAFARQADDFADEDGYEGNRLELLADWARRLDLAADGEAEDPVFIALSDTIRTQQVPVGPMRDLLKAFEQDVTVKGYGTFDSLLDYCRLSANPVGRLVLSLFDHSDEHLLVQSDFICTALQLANFWQDVTLDLDKKRCYIPKEDLLRFRCSPEELAARKLTPAFIEVMRYQVNRTRQMFGRGSRLPAEVGGRLGLELKLVVLGGLRILERIEQVGYDVFTRRPSLTAADWGRMLVRAPWF